MLKPFSTSGGGQCQWTFAEKGGKSYFLKQFLAPTYPTPDSPGSAVLKEHKRTQCAAFESHHKRFFKALGSVSGEGGNLVVTHEFFRDGSHYYKSTARVPGSALASRDPSVDFRALIAIPIAVAGSLQILHRIGVVHGDLKPANILVEHGARATPKLIDFDNSFLAGEPPPPDELVGDVAYYSPELLRYVNGAAEARELKTSSDVFALGLVFHTLFAGSVAGPGAGYPAELVLGGKPLPLSLTKLPDRAANLIRSMLRPDPDSRPSMAMVWDELKAIQAGRDAVPPPSDGPTLRGTLAVRKAAARRSGSVLRGTLLDPKSDAEALADCRPVFDRLRREPEPNERVWETWGFARAIVHGDRSEIVPLASHARLLDLLPERLRAIARGIEEGLNTPIRIWIYQLLTSKTPSSVRRPENIVGAPVAVCAPPSIDSTTEPRGMHEEAPRAPTESIPSDSEVARAAWSVVRGGGDVRAEAEAWFRFRALGSRISAEDVERGRAAVREWGASIVADANG